MTMPLLTRRAIAILSTLACISLSACGGGANSTSQVKPAGTPAPAIDTGPPPKPTVLVLGDSIAAGFGLLSMQAFPALLQEKLEKDGYDVEVENAGVSGDTTAGGLSRLESVLTSHVKILIVALGGNDALRGLSPASTHDNLTKIIQAARGKGIEVMVAGMQAPPNLGEDYKTAFNAAFSQVATESKNNITYIPFLLEGVAGNPELNQTDGIHPTAAGAAVIANTIYEKLKPLVDYVLSR